MSDTPAKLLSESMAGAAVGVLGSMLIDEATVGPMLMAVGEEDFVIPEHKNIYRTIRDLFGRGKGVDALLVNAELGGGYNQILADIINLTPTSANADAYAAALRRTSRLWQIKEIGAKLELAEDEEELRALVDKANQLLTERRGIKRMTMEDAFRDFFKRHSQEKPSDFLRWGFGDLDEQLSIGSGDMVVVGGYPSAGKTAFALQIACAMAKQKRVGFYSYETSAEKLHDRFVACQGDVSYTAITRGKMDIDDYRNVKEARPTLTAPALDLIEASGMTVNDISAYAMAHHYDVIMVDYLQKISVSRSGRGMSDFERVSVISNDLQQLGRRTGKTIVALSQLSRPEKSKNGKTPAPTMQSLRQSGQIEQDADVILLLYKEVQDFTSNRRVLDIPKNKDGVAGLGLLLDFDGDKQRFRKSIRQPIPKKEKPEDPQTNLFKPVAAGEDNPFEKN